MSTSQGWALGSSYLVGSVHRLQTRRAARGRTQTGDPSEERGTTLQERLESSDIGRLLISAFLVVTVGGLLVWNLPGSELRRRLVPVVTPYFNAVGLDQGWDVFAPQPRLNSVEFFGRLDYADGSQITWRIPTGSPLVSPYRTYHWQKWTEFVINDDLGAELWEPAARWMARTHTKNGRFPLQVTLVRRWYTNPPPGGRQGEHPPWQETPYYTLQLPQSPS